MPASSIIVGVALLLVALGFLSVSSNRLVRSRLLSSGLLFAAYIVANVLAEYGRLPANIVAQIRVFNPLLAALGASIMLVVVAINPLRHNRLPDRFPTIVQDALIIALFAMVATLFLQEKILATTAVGAVVIGFALQDTLGNLFSGLAIQIDKPFSVGHWVRIAGIDGMVTEVTWRATTIRTKTGNFVIVPNSGVAKETITNYSEPTHDTMLEIEVGASYDALPNDVKAVILEALSNEPLIVRSPAPDVLLTDFAASAITYKVRVWTADFADEGQTRDRVRSRIYYAFRRAGITIPYPIQVQINQEAAPIVSADATARAHSLDGVGLFSSLHDSQREQLIGSSRTLLFEAGQVIMREGEAGASMFILKHGAATVTLVETDGAVATLKDGAVFGEMSLLTGDTRTATVTAVSDCHVLEIGAEAFRSVVLQDAALVERIAAEVAAKRAENAQHRVVHGTDTTPIELPHTFAARVRRFLRLER